MCGAVCVAAVPTIPLANLAVAFVPVLVLLAVLHYWSLDSRTALLAVVRMFIQLLLVGYVLAFVFQTERAAVVLVVLGFMLCVASWIALRPLGSRRPTSFGKALIAIALGGVTTLLLTTQAVLQLEPWFWPRFMVPLAGMIFANAMNAVSLAAERFADASAQETRYAHARDAALRAALIPSINTLLAVGLVSFPGMMTGQILAGVDPLIAVRYQIVIMCVVFGSSGLSAACYLLLQRPGTTAV